MNVSGSPQDFWFSLPTSASKENFWRIWTDVPNWSAWDTPLKTASIQNSMALGTRGEIITKNGQKSAFVISQFSMLDSYTMTTALPLGRLEIKRFFSLSNGQLVFTHRVRFLGLSAGLFAALLGRGFMQELPVVMQKLKELAEKS
jgi:hypothetical protein